MAKDSQSDLLYLSYYLFLFHTSQSPCTNPFALRNNFDATVNLTYHIDRFVAELDDVYHDAMEQIQNISTASLAQMAVLRQEAGTSTLERGSLALIHTVDYSRPNSLPRGTAPQRI